ncbi:hypothetical protein [Actinomadura alba]|uniref:Uncharacterized protein n=1 Tax=Actinomadura alba TaxID=406431 RepID=A0ABR7LNM1_9ACTN|nr:hypothetical protein [Actinomadura alba]MBC6466335.1 hypothetical protein [Actinomadura alba]
MTETAHGGPGGPAGTGGSGPQPWTSDSAAIDRWASESPLTGGSQPWTPSTEAQPTPSGTPAHGSPEPWPQPPGPGPASGNAPGASPERQWSPSQEPAPANAPAAEAWSPGGPSTQSWTPQFESAPAPAPNGTGPWATAEPLPEPLSGQVSSASAGGPPAMEADPWYSTPPPSATRPSADNGAHGTPQAWGPEPEPTPSWSQSPEPSPSWSQNPEPSPSWASEPDATQAWSVQQPAQQPTAQQPPAEPSDATQAWSSQYPAGQGPPAQSPQSPAAQSPAAQSWTPDANATQAWSAQPAPDGPGSWSGAGDQQGTGPTESIVPDSWFAGPREAPPPPEAPERWTPQPEPMNQDPWGHQPEPMNQDPWGRQPQADGAPAWGAQTPGGMAPMPHHDTAMLAPGYPPHDGPGHPQEGHRDRASRPLIFAVAGLVAVALVAVAFVMWPSGDKDPEGQRTPAAVQSTAKAADPAARQQATAVNSLLNQSAVSRGELGRALASAKRCKGLPAAIGGMQRVAQQRQQQVARAQALKVNALANGTQLRAHLAKSIQLSLDVDRAYLGWAQRAQGCKGRPKADANYQRGGQLSNQATISKQRFAALWSPVAKEQRLRPRTANQF